MSAHEITDTYGELVTATAEYDTAKGGWTVRLHTGCGADYKAAWLTPDAAEELGAALFCRAAQARRREEADHEADVAAVLRRVRDGLAAPAAEGSKAA